MATQWISVTDRVPDTCRDIFVCTKAKNGHRDIDKGYYIKELRRFAHRGSAKVTHWMELPELPDEENDVERY